MMVGRGLRSDAGPRAAVVLLIPYLLA
jgi:hypothetical protein